MGWQEMLIEALIRLHKENESVSNKSNSTVTTPKYGAFYYITTELWLILIYLIYKNLGGLKI